MKTKMLAHINELLYIEIWVVQEWVELFCNLHVLSVDLATSSDSYECELTSVLAAIYSCSSSYYLTSFFQNVFNKLWKQVWNWFN